jgi:hypothetical protein
MSYSGGLYLDDDLEPYVRKRADESFNGKINTYITALVRTDRELTQQLTENVSAAEIARWRQCEVTLLRAAQDALNLLNAETPEGRDRLAKALANSILRASMRETAPTKPQSATVAELGVVE